MEWHDDTCRKLDLSEGDGFRTCLSCGSTTTISEDALPRIRQNKSEIRLLRIAPGSFADEVQCEIVVEDLHSNLEYSALSYTWANESGDATKDETVLVDHRPFSVTKNCKLALRRARMVLTTVVIWVDAICIDQNDDHERGHQVMLMPEIYSRAEKVLVYIGESTGSNMSAVRYLKGDDAVMNNAIALLENITDRRRDPDSERLGNSGLREVKFELDELFSRRYFSRIWILQEIALARGATLLCGEESIPWKRVVEMASRLIEPEMRPAILDFNRRLCLLPRQELAILDMGRQSQATNARDKVYALLGLLPNRRIAQVEADYTLTIEELYIRVAVGLASTYDWSDILLRAGTYQRLIETLPSWTPDWSFIKPGGSKSYERHELHPEPQPLIEWVKYEQKHQRVIIRAIRCRSQGDFGLIAGKYHEKVSWMALRSSYTSASSTYLRFNRDGKLGKLVEQRFRSIYSAQPKSFGLPSSNENVLMLELRRDIFRAPKDVAWTLSKASLGGESHIYITIEDSLTMFNLKQSQVQDRKAGGPLLWPLRDPALSSSTPLEEDLWIQDFCKGHLPKGQSLEDLSLFVDNNVKFWRFLVKSFLVRDEWVEIR